MASYGIGTWDGNGNYNNYGIKPVSVIGIINLSSGQNSGSWNFDVPQGMKVGFAVTLDTGGQTIGRRIVASGNNISIYPASDIGIGNYPASNCELVVFLENA
ncbi:hypothetical protein bas12_0023 [Escherichia phage BrunoManser]|uniref:Tail fiber protein n=1 Tax=Escherichia phage BrunoManser TaxID=2851976 RepID=A0AAE7VPS8_9CAUD|nr:hypothetical protein bas12_0023 [Escherichia phage BrunoManser]